MATHIDLSPADGDAHDKDIVARVLNFHENTHPLWFFRVAKPKILLLCITDGDDMYLILYHFMTCFITGAS